MAKKSDAENKPTKKKQNSTTGDVISESLVPAEHGLSHSEADEQTRNCAYNDSSEGQTEPPAEKIERLIAAFSNKDGWKRRNARMALVAIGKPAVPCLTKALKHQDAKVRWQTIKALGAIGDPRSGPDMVSALTDENFEIRWLAAEALCSFGGQCCFGIASQARQVTWRHRIGDGPKRRADTMGYVCKAWTSRQYGAVTQARYIQRWFFPQLRNDRHGVGRMDISDFLDRVVHPR
jgi:hypothetical protein